MESLANKIVLITGASSGIGYACAEEFAAAGARLILAARRKDRIDALSKELEKQHKTRSLAIQLDVRDQKAVQKSIEGLPKEWASIDVLVNNAGLSRGIDKLHVAKINDWEEMIDTNIKGLLYVSRAILPGMVERKSGMIINIGSIAGHEVYPGGNVYCATKHAVDAITRGLRWDLVDTPVRVCTVDPGLVETEFSMVRFRGDEAKAKKVYENVKVLEGKDVAEAVVFCATRPQHVQIGELLILPTIQAAPTMVYRPT